MNLIRQPEGSSLCGQACVAMAAGVSLEEAIEAVGHQHRSGTWTRELVRGLRKLGVPCADRCRRTSQARALPPRAILSTRNGRSGHWMLHWDGVIYDPEDRYPDYDAHWRITSYLELFC